MKPLLLTALGRTISTAPLGRRGDDIEVPAIAWKYSPGGPAETSMGVGVLPARICTPGAVMSGLMNCPAGPREENEAMTSPWSVPFTPSGHEAFALG